MSLAADRPEFAPPPQRGTPRAVVLALCAHVVLIAALTWGVSWKRDAEDDAVEAEIWSSTVQQAAPRATPQPVTPPPTPAPPPPPAAAPPPPPPPPPPPAPRVRAPDPTPAPQAPDIALEREKKLREQREERDAELARQEKLKQQQAAKKAQEKKELEARQKAEDEAERKEAQQKALADAKRKEAAEAKQAAADAAKKKEAAEAKAAADAKKLADAKAAADAKKAADAKASAQSAADRAAALKRMQAMAGSGGEGNAAKSSGPSGSYGGKVAAAVRPNVVFPDADMVNGNPGAEFDIRLAPDGTIVGTPQLVQSSGLPAWDQAALRALQKTERLPRDIDGTVPSRLIVTLRPKR